LLPKPENNFELLIPEDEEEGGEAKAATIEDAAERDAREKRQKEEAIKQELARRSTVVQMSLPRLPTIDVDRLMKNLTEEGEDAVRKEINEELVKLMQHDSIAHPLPGTSRPGSTHSTYEHPEDGYLHQARAAVRKELAGMLGFPDANEEQVKQGLIAVAKDEEVDETWSWASVRESLAFDPDLRAWMEVGETDNEKRKKGLSTVLDEIRDRMAREAGRVGKTEKKLGVTLGGYQARSGVLSKRLGDAFAELERAQMELQSFSRLEANESAAGPRRLQLLEEEIEKLERRERTLQTRYGELEGERGGISERVSALEERLMAEAEVLNEGAE
jgi:pre-mRNA-splicing factor CDC5/CEF1